MKIHAILLALNEDVFIKAQIDTIYPFCHAISVITQYDRDWYGKRVMPDQTVPFILNYDDPDGKINLVIRRSPDETAARNMEMLSFNKKTTKGIQTHGNLISDIENFHNAPDYFWILDADEIYDVKTIPAIIDYLGKMKPRGMRMIGYNYLRTWNNRVPRRIVDFTQFGFIKPGILFKQRRIINWNESRLSKLLHKLHLPDISSRVYHFISCPESIGVFHHGCWLGDNARLRSKFSKSSHVETHNQKEDSVDILETVIIPTKDLPENIQEAAWPKNFFLDGQ